MKYAALLATFLLPSAVLAQVTWKPVTPGNMQWGNTPQAPRVQIQNRIGPMTYGSDGSAALNVDGGTVSPDGSYGRWVGDVYFVYNSAGQHVRSCTPISGQLYCQDK